MTEAASSIDVLLLKIHEPQHSSWRGSAVSCPLLVVIGLCTVWFDVVAHSRYKVIGKTDPKTGCHIEFTVSSRFRLTRLFPPIHEMGDEFGFSSKPSPIALQWIYSHILHEPLPGAVFSSRPLTFYGTASKDVAQTVGIRTDRQGFPYYDDKFPASSTVGHVIVSGCPATLRHVSIHGMPPPFNLVLLIVKPRDAQVYFVFAAEDENSDPSGAVGELMKIKDSICIKKVK